jgi:hypothetical protein
MRDVLDGTAGVDLSVRHNGQTAVAAAANHECIDPIMHNLWTAAAA